MKMNQHAENLLTSAQSQYSIRELKEKSQKTNFISILCASSTDSAVVEKE